MNDQCSSCESDLAVSDGYCQSCLDRLHEVFDS